MSNLWDSVSLLFNVGLFVSTLRAAAPLIFAALGGVFSERSGVVNIALEGIMLVGAFMGVMGTYFLHDPWVGLLIAVLSGVVFALMFGVIVIRYRADQVVTGVALNMLALGLTGFLLRLVFHHAGQSPPLEQKLPDWIIPFDRLPGLSRFPALRGFVDQWIQPVFGQHTPPVYLAILAAFLAHYVLFRTPFGLRLRAVGEHPRAADTVGVNVYLMRYLAVAISGALAGLGGATLSLGMLSSFIENMTSGRGFIALAAMIFGKWTPLGAFGACLLFGFFDALQMLAQTLGFQVPREFFLMLPYLLTMAVLAGVIGRAAAPAADGKPYDKSHA
ncbi:MAG TPA: ABC transporter permease [Firmicutes bacterium]|nr:ABC transporter permease [Bacillota bacterium]